MSNQSLSELDGNYDLRVSGSFKIGRSPLCNIIVSDTHVSKVHCSLNICSQADPVSSADSKFKVLITDHSSNGTCISSKTSGETIKLESEKSTLLKEGDVILLTRTTDINHGVIAYKYLSSPFPRVLKCTYQPEESLNQGNADMSQCQEKDVETAEPMPNVNEEDSGFKDEGLIKTDICMHVDEPLARSTESSDSKKCMGTDGLKDKSENKDTYKHIKIKQDNLERIDLEVGDDTFTGIKPAHSDLIVSSQQNTPTNFIGQDDDKSQHRKRKNQADDQFTWTRKVRFKEPIEENLEHPKSLIGISVKSDKQCIEKLDTHMDGKSADYASFDVTGKGSCTTFTKENHTLKHTSTVDNGLQKACDKIEVKTNTTTSLVLKTFCDSVSNPLSTACPSELSKFVEGKDSPQIEDLAQCDRFEQTSGFDAFEDGSLYGKCVHCGKRIPHVTISLHEAICEGHSQEARSQDHMSLSSLPLEGYSFADASNPHVGSNGKCLATSGDERGVIACSRECEQSSNGIDQMRKNDSEMIDDKTCAKNDHETPRTLPGISESQDVLGKCIESETISLSTVTSSKCGQIEESPISGSAEKHEQLGSLTDGSGFIAPHGNLPTLEKEESKERCTFCSALFPVPDLVLHVSACSKMSTVTCTDSDDPESMQEACPYCANYFDVLALVEHVDHCKNLSMLKAEEILQEECSPSSHGEQGSDSASRSEEDSLMSDKELCPKCSGEFSLLELLNHADECKGDTPKTSSGLASNVHDHLDDDVDDDDDDGSKEIVNNKSKDKTGGSDISGCGDGKMNDEVSLSDQTRDDKSNTSYKIARAEHEKDSYSNFGIGEEDDDNESDNDDDRHIGEDDGITYGDNDHDNSCSEEENSISCIISKDDEGKDDGEGDFDEGDCGESDCDDDERIQEDDGITHGDSDHENSCSEEENSISCIISKDDEGKDEDEGGIDDDDDDETDNDDDRCIEEDDGFIYGNSDHDNSCSEEENSIPGIISKDDDGKDEDEGDIDDDDDDVSDNDDDRRILGEDYGFIYDDNDHDNSCSEKGNSISCIISKDDEGRDEDEDEGDIDDADDNESDNDDNIRIGEDDGFLYGDSDHDNSCGEKENSISCIISKDDEGRDEGVSDDDDDDVGYGDHDNRVSDDEGSMCNDEELSAHKGHTSDDELVDAMETEDGADNDEFELCPNCRKLFHLSRLIEHASNCTSVSSDVKTTMESKTTCYGTSSSSESSTTAPIVYSDCNFCGIRLPVHMMSIHYPRCGKHFATKGKIKSGEGFSRFEVRYPGVFPEHGGRIYNLSSRVMVNDEKMDKHPASTSGESSASSETKVINSAGDNREADELKRISLKRTLSSLDSYHDCEEQCMYCLKMFAVGVLVEHASACATLNKPATEDLEQCCYCLQTFPLSELINHAQNCDQKTASSSQEDSQDDVSANSQSSSKDLLERCMYCFKDFPVSKLIRHSQKCDGDMSGPRERFQGFVPSVHDLSAVSSVAILNDSQRTALQYVISRSAQDSKKISSGLLTRVERLGYSKSDLTRTLQWVRSAAPIIIHINLDKVLKFLVNDTHYRNQFETGTSGGSTDLVARKSWEDRIFNNSYKHSSPSERVKYGVLNIVGDPHGVKSCVAYGDSFLQLKKIRLRTTFASMDTSGAGVKLSCCEHYENVLHAYTDPEITAIIDVATGKVPCRRSDCISQYKEVQIHGPVSLSENVECIVVNSRHQGDPRIRSLLDRFVEQNKCNLIWMDPNDLAGAVPPLYGALGRYLSAGASSGSLTRTRPRGSKKSKRMKR